jgi:hypothetical protein
MLPIAALCVSSNAKRARSAPASSNARSIGLTVAARYRSTGPRRSHGAGSRAQPVPVRQSARWLVAPPRSQARGSSRSARPRAETLSADRLALLAPQSHEQFVRPHLVVLEIEDRLTAGREAMVIERVTSTTCGTRAVRRTACRHTPGGLSSEPDVPAPPPGRDVGSAPA